MTYRLRVGPQGRIVIPSALRKVMALKAGTILIGQSEGDRLVLRPRREIEDELWHAFSRVKGSLSSELISERRRQARRESGD
jgi:AbrB family looped-hinge helix DNA binding protein